MIRHDYFQTPSQRIKFNLLLLDKNTRLNFSSGLPMHIHFFAFSKYKIERVLHQKNI